MTVGFWTSAAYWVAVMYFAVYFGVCLGFVVVTVVQDWRWRRRLRRRRGWIR